MKRKRWPVWLACALFLSSAPAAADGLSDAGTAFVAVERGNYPRAVRYYTRAIWSQELGAAEEIAAYLGRAFSYIKLLEFDKAVEDYGKVIERRPNHAGAYYNRGVTHAAAGDLKAALEDYTYAIWLGYRDSYKAFYNRGTIYESRGDFKHAVADFKEALRLAPDEPRIRDKLDALAGAQ